MNTEIGAPLLSATERAWCEIAGSLFFIMLPVGMVAGDIRAAVVGEPMPWSGQEIVVATVACGAITGALIADVRRIAAKSA